MVVRGTVNRGRRQGRKKKRWKDNIRKWTGLQFAESRKKWRKLAVKSSVVPQPPSLRGR